MLYFGYGLFNGAMKIILLTINKETVALLLMTVLLNGFGVCSAFFDIIPS